MFRALDQPRERRGREALPQVRKRSDKKRREIGPWGQVIRYSWFLCTRF
jgi:hypothetical protein